MKITGIQTQSVQVELDSFQVTLELQKEFIRGLKLLPDSYVRPVQGVPTFVTNCDRTSLIDFQRPATPEEVEVFDALEVLKTYFRGIS